MENNPPVSATVADRLQPDIEAIDAPKGHEALVQDFKKDAGEIAIDATVELPGEVEPSFTEQEFDGMDYQEINKNIDSLLKSGVSPDAILKHLGPNVYWYGNIGKLLDAGIDARNVLNFLTQDKVGNTNLDVNSSSTIAQNLDAFIRSGIGANSIAAVLEPGWLSQCFDKLVAAGLSQDVTLSLVDSGKVTIKDIDKARETRARFASVDKVYGVDNVYDFNTGKTIQATRADQEVAA